MLEEGHRVETILHTIPYKVHYVTYIILIQPIFLSYCVHSVVKKILRKPALDVIELQLPSNLISAMYGKV